MAKFKLGETIDYYLPNRDLKLLVSVRILRSLVQGYLLVFFAIYLSQIGFSATLIGLTLGIGSVVSAFLTFATGILSDRYGRKPFLLAYGVLMAISGLVFSFTTVPFILITTSALGAIGRGGQGGGQAGPFAPAETALLAERTKSETRSRTFSFNTFAGTFATTLGALLAGVPDWLHSQFHWSFLEAYRPMYLAVALVGVLTYILMLFIQESPRKSPETHPHKVESTRKQNINYIWKISVAGIINGFGIGFVGGLIPYWLYLRFKVSPSSIGPIMALSSLLTAFLSLYVAEISRRLGDIVMITFSRLLGVLFTILLIFSPNFIVAAILVVLRTIGTMVAMPIRQSYTMGIIDDDMRGTAAGISGVARRLPGAISPAIAGYWFDQGLLELPFLASAVFMALNAALYFYWFHNIKPKDDE